MLRHQRGLFSSDWDIDSPTQQTRLHVLRSVCRLVGFTGVLAQMKNLPNSSNRIDVGTRLDENEAGGRANELLSSNRRRP
jgi:hypothetical protein